MWRNNFCWYFIRCNKWALRLSGNELTIHHGRLIKEKRGKKYLLNLHWKMHLYDYGYKKIMACMLFVYHKEKRRTKSKGSLLEESPRGWEKKKKKRNNDVAKTTVLSIIALIFFVCRFATWLAGNEGRWLKFTGGWIKILPSLCFQKKKKKETFTLVASLCTFPCYN